MEQVMTFKSKKKSRQTNGEKGGRPKQDSQVYIEIPKIKLVNLTSNQYDVLSKRYGKKIFMHALSILDDWLKSGSPMTSKYIGKNHYAYFRSDGWVVNEAIRAEQ